MNDIRRENQNKIRDAFSSAKAMVASEIADKTTLSVVTINAVLEEMCELGEIKRGAIRKGKSGRPSVLYEYNRRYKPACIIYSYASDGLILTNAIVINRFGEEIYSKSLELKDFGKDLFFEIMDDIKLQYPDISLILLGFPGYQNGKTVSSSDFATFLTDKIFGKLEKKYDAQVQFVNDINAVTYGHNSRHSADVKNEVGIFLPKNYFPGVGIVIENKIYTGTGNFAGEIGFLPTEIKWTELHKRSSADIAKQLSATLAMLSCVIAPQHIVIYSEFVNKKTFSMILERLEKRLPEGYVPSVTLLNDLGDDFRRGLVCIAVKGLYGADI